MTLVFAAGTTSKLKLRAVAEALKRLGIYTGATGVEVDSIVPNQPFGFEMMRKGAEHRALFARQRLDADFGIGIESGLVKVELQWYDPPCVIVVGRDDEPSVAYGALFPIPERMAEEVQTTHGELGHVIQAAAGGGEKDPHKWLSDGEVSRDEIIIQAILCAFAPLRHPDRYT